MARIALLTCAALLALPVAAAAARPAMLVIGDSLATDSAGDLRTELGGWRVNVRAWGGVKLETGMRWLREERSLPPILAFSLFTNDPPRDGRRLEAAVVDTLRRHPGCHIWATLFRGGGGLPNEFTAANARLRKVERRHSDRMVLIDWAAWGDWAGTRLVPDGTHPTRAGNWLRARLYANAAQRCARRQASEAIRQLPAPAATWLSIPSRRHGSRGGLADIRRAETTVRR